MSQGGKFFNTSTFPSIPTTFIENTGSAIPVANTLHILGNYVLAGGGAPCSTNGSGNTVTINVQLSEAAGSSSANNAGVCSFNNIDFTVDANGFVSLKGGSALLTLTGNSGGAISPTSGNINTIGTGSITVVGVMGTSTLTTQLTGLTNHAVLIGAGTATITNVGPTSTSGQVLQSKGSLTDPAFSTATYPSTTTINQILYSSSANVVGGLATANNGVLTTGATGIPVITALSSNGQLIIGSGSGAPAAATLTAGAGVSITNGANSITIAANGSAFAYTNVAHGASPYTVLSTDYYISVDCSLGTVTLKFPNAPTANTTWVIKDRTGSASTNNISITTVGGSVTIDGQTTYKITSNYGAVNLLANSSPTYEVF